MQEETLEKNNAVDVQEKATETPADGADQAIKKHVYVSLGVGLIPIPFLDFVGVAGIQLNLLRKLAQIYKIPFSKNIVKNLIGALIGGAFPASAGPRLAFSIAKTVPGIGQALGAVSSSAVSGACTYAIGKVFKRHFADGGTFLSFDPERAKEFYEDMFQEGQEVVAEINARKV